VTVAVPGTVGERELGLKTVAAWREGERDREVAGAGMRIGREFFADPVHCAATGRQGQNRMRSVAFAHAGLLRSCILVARTDPKDRLARSVVFARSRKAENATKVLGLPEHSSGITLLPHRYASSVGRGTTGAGMRVDQTIRLDRVSIVACRLDGRGAGGDRAAVHGADRDCLDLVGAPVRWRRRRSSSRGAGAVDRFVTAFRSIFAVR